MASTFTFPDFIGYPVSQVYDREYPHKPKPDRTYYNMTLEDYPPYKALGSKPVLHGPVPYSPSLCGCGLYKIGDSCVCSMECMRKPIYAWAKENPEAFNAKQKEMARWEHLWKLWCKQKDENDYEWSIRTEGVRHQFMKRQDEESPIGCAECERWGYNSCTCRCECGSKTCYGRCSDDRDDCW